VSEPNKSNTSTGLVSSGSGQSVNAKAISAGDFAYGALGNGTAGGLGNAALLSTTTILPNTRRTKISRTQLEAADKEYTRQMNILSQFWSVKDTSSPAYAAQKQNAMMAQYQWELARNNLEEVVSSELSRREEPIEVLPGEIVTSPTIIGDLEGIVPQVDAAPVEDEIVVIGRPRDNRIRISPKEGQRDEIFGDENSILYMLRETDGVFFPYTPTIDFSHRAEYSSMAPTHANTSYYTYTHTPAIQITIQGQFSAQNLAEAKYTLASMHFFRTVTKMHFGFQEAEEGTAGLPPPVLNLNGYGEYMFDNLSIIIQEFKMDMPNNVDYIEVEHVGGLAWVPTLTTFTISCVVQNTPKQQRDEFNFKEFASGELMRDGNGWI
jgi:hypothetical protein